MTTAMTNEGSMTVSDEEHKALVRRFSEELISRGNYAVADELIAENYVNHNPIPGQVPGRAGFKESLALLRAAFPDLHESIEALVAEGDRVAVRATRHGTHRGPFMGLPATGKAVTVPTMYILRVVAGKIVEAWLNWDMLGLLGQLGAVPAPG